MTVEVVLAAADLLPIRPCVRPLRIGRLLLSRRIPTMRASACGGLIAGLAGRDCEEKSSLSATAPVPSEQQGLPAGTIDGFREMEARQAGAELGLRPEDMLFLRLPDRFVPYEGEEAERAIASSLIA